MINEMFMCTLVGLLTFNNGAWMSRLGIKGCWG